jgi:hypothetical protein
MKTFAKLTAGLGAATCAGVIFYAAGVLGLVGSTLLFVPLFLLLRLLQSRVRRKKVKDAGATVVFLSVGIWLLAASLYGVRWVERPGQEAVGMFGVLFFIAPAVASFVSCLLVVPGLSMTRGPLEV